MSETSSRLLELLSLLQGRRDWPGSELAERVEVSGRTIRRDIERLRGLGYQVEPRSLVNRGRRWYLVAWDRGRDAWRTFRVDRLARPAPIGVRFTPRELPAKDAAAYVRQSIAERPNRFEAIVTLHAPLAEVTRRVPSYWGTIEPIDADTCRYTAGD